MRSNDKVIMQKLDSLKELIELKFKNNKGEHNEIVKHQKETNGRVTRLEAYKNIATGAVIVSNVVVIPILLWIIKAHLVQ